MDKMHILSTALIGSEELPGFLPQMVEVMREMRGDMKAFHRLVLIVLAVAVGVIALRDTVRTFRMGADGVHIEQGKTP